MAWNARRDSGSWDHATTFRDLEAAVGSGRCVEVLVAVLRVSRSVGELAEDLSLDRSRVSQCLGALVKAGLLMFRRDGRRHEYHATPNIAVAARDDLLILELKALDGARVLVVLPPDVVTRISSGDRRASAPFRSVGVLSIGITPQPPEIHVRPGAAHGPLGDAPTAHRPATGP